MCELRPGALVCSHCAIGFACVSSVFAHSIGVIRHRVCAEHVHEEGAQGKTGLVLRRRTARGNREADDRARFKWRQRRPHLQPFIARIVHTHRSRATSSHFCIAFSKSTTNIQRQARTFEVETLRGCQSSSTRPGAIAAESQARHRFPRRPESQPLHHPRVFAVSIFSDFLSVRPLQLR